MAALHSVHKSWRELRESQPERPAVVYRMGILFLILAQGVLHSYRPFQIPHDNYLTLAGFYALSHSCWWGLIAFGQRRTSSAWLVSVGHVLGLLTDLAVILLFASQGSEAHGLWLLLLLPWIAVLALNGRVVDSVITFDTLVGVAGLVVLFTGPLAYQYSHTPTSVLIFWGGFLLTWHLMRQRIERDVQHREIERNKEIERDVLFRLLDSLPDGCLVISGQGRILLSNQEAQRILGRESADGNEPPAWLWPDSPGDGWHVRRHSEKAAVNRILFQRLALPWGDDEGACLILVADGDARSFRGEHEARQDRLAAIGQLAAGLAHELGNPIAIIQSCAAYLHDEYKEGALGEDLDVIQREAGRCREMIDRILALASARESTPQENDLRESVHRAVGLVRYKAEGVAVEVTIPPHPLWYVYDDNQMVAILVNLLLNATASTAGSPKKEVRLTVAAEADGIAITISDTGCGISPDQLERIFDPFFTRREGGTGLGLAMVHHAVTALGGTIDVTSKVGEGTTFSVSLPARHSNQ